MSIGYGACTRSYLHSSMGLTVAMMHNQGVDGVVKESASVDYISLLTMLTSRRFRASLCPPQCS
jgi:hypothetical protein